MADEIKAVDHLKPFVVQLTCTKCRSKHACRLNKYLECGNAWHLTRLDLMVMLRASSDAAEQFCQRCFSTPGADLVCQSCCACAPPQTPVARAPCPVVTGNGFGFDGLVTPGISTPCPAPCSTVSSQGGENVLLSVAADGTEERVHVRRNVDGGGRVMRFKYSVSPPQARPRAGAVTPVIV